MPRKSRINIDEVRQLVEQGNSTYKVAELVGCNQAHIVRMIKKYNATSGNPIKVRSKSEAQKLYAEKNGHQRVGKTHSDEAKIAISDGMKDFFESPDGDKAKEKMSEAKEESWKKMDPQDKAAQMANLRVAQREALKSGDGSKFENFIAESLQNDGFAIEQRTSSYTPGNHFHIDIAIKDKSLAIEIDGPTHFQDIYGAEKLQQVITQDAEKDALLHSVGFDVLRVQDLSGNTSRARYQRVLEKINEIITTRSGRKPKTFTVRP